MRRPLLLAAVLLSILPAAAQEGRMPSAQQQPELRGIDPPWIVAGAAAVVRLYGQNLVPEAVRFDEPRLQVRRLKTEAFSPTNDSERRLGNSRVELEVAAPAELRPGAYRFALVQPGGRAEGTLVLDVPAPEIQETEPNGDLRAPQALPSGSVTVLGKLEGDGADVFRIDGRAGELWRFEVFARRLNPPSNLEAVLRLRDPRMAPIRTAVDQGADCAIELTLPMDGPYRLELFDGDNRSGAEFRYRLAVRRIGTTPPAAARLGSRESDIE